MVLFPVPFSPNDRDDRKPEAYRLTSPTPNSGESDRVQKFRPKTRDKLISNFL